MKKGMADEQFTAQVIETTRLVHENERLKRRLAELEPAERVEETING
jgi:regulator of replication initiation timing